MAKPTTLNEIVTCVRSSRLIVEEELRDFLTSFGQRQAVCSLTPDQLLHHMIEARLLTPFQANHLREGRTQGFQLGQYRLLDKIGSGGMGQVFLAEHVALGRRVALKILRKNMQGKSLALTRFAREAEAAARVDHPNVVRVYDVELESNPPYLIMEYVDGLTLQSIVAQFGPMPNNVVAHIGRQVLLGLEAVFHAGLVHRDIKPANVMLDRRGHAHLTDLGIVRFEGDNLTQQASEKQILGTIDYLSPEQAIDSSSVDTRADIYSVGATLYFLLAGHPPFNVGSVRAKLIQLHSMEPPELKDLRPEIPTRLSKVIAKMMAKEPEARYQTPAEAAAGLANFDEVSEHYANRYFGDGSRLTTDESGEQTPMGSDFLNTSSCQIVALRNSAEIATVQLSNQEMPGLKAEKESKETSSPGSTRSDKESTSVAPRAEPDPFTELPLAASSHVITRKQEEPGWMGQRAKIAAGVCAGFLMIVFVAIRWILR